MRRIEDLSPNYYDDPYAISNEEAQEMNNLPLTPSEANYVLVNSIANDIHIEPNVLKALREIRDSDNGGDLAATVRYLDKND